VTFGSFLGLFAELYDPASGQWSSAVAAACGPSCFFGGSATLLHNGKVLVAGGFGGKYPNRRTTAGVSFYDPATNSWSTGGSLQVARTRQTASLLANGQVLIAGGENETSGGSTVLTSAELYAP
jgi:N-acetylneuraminic acid mutarotase